MAALRPLPSPRTARSQSLANSSAPIKRKPLSATASPLATRYSTRDYLEIARLPRPEHRFSRSFSLDSPTLYDFPSLAAAVRGNAPDSPPSLETSQPYVPDRHPLELASAGDLQLRNIWRSNPADAQTPSDAVSRDEDLSAEALSPTTQGSSHGEVESNNHTDSAEPLDKRSTVPNTMSVLNRRSPPPHLDLGPVDTEGPDSEDNNNLNKPLPKSPASSKLGTYFGWANSDSSTTDFSDKGFSPLPSPYSLKPAAFGTDSDETPVSAHSSTFSHDAHDNPSLSPGPIEEMEDELKAISAELASSIRREMDLEDLVDRLQDQVNNPQAPGKRTSDYFSDSGYSSAKFSEYDHAKEEISQIQRRAEQDKAQITLELTGKLQDERHRRKLRAKDASGRVKELEATCEDLRRRLSEERQVKDNFEDLLSADNLRDEIAQAAEIAKSAYDTSKMQQELQSLKSENSELKQTGSRISVALSRSASVAGGSYNRKARPQSLLTRSNTVKQTEPREVLADRLKDVEAQRDALHSALRSLLERQEFQNRENNKKIRGSPRKAGYQKEVSVLREEINVLRRRAEDTIEQKWEVEKGLGEISSLRSLLKEKDILIPDTLARSSRGSEKLSGPVSSESLEKAYKDLQAAYTEALERIKALEDSTASDEKTRLAMQRLEQSLSAAVTERDFARSEASSYLDELETLRATEKDHFATERDLADQLRDSARRVEELAQQVRTQLATNATLRTRLSDTVARGEANQRHRLRTLEEQVVAAQTNAEERVTRHEEELATLKEAQSTQLQRLRDASPLSPMLSARSGASGQPTRISRMSSPLLSPNADRPGIRRSSTTPLHGVDGSITEQVETLKGRVAELEGALAAADAEMQEVVSRMNTAQIEVMMLQEEREEAVRETRRLQRILEEEKVRVFEDRFRTITAVR
ncbi:hypothetical protein B0T19DRAFT_447126 [Cercophora scortea]|uniref:DUF7603 domain-containing protein n=1 Tax=Cercophora scortea TaxID=314031 RepID=A0AAE0J2J6_9PEZI|nr:hypothetical protein B0T19DRAFT_447126 [Cercophora scortea]